MTVIPFRGAKRPVPVRASFPDIGQLTRTYLQASICFYLAPWLFWLSILQDDDTPGHMSPERLRDRRF